MSKRTATATAPLVASKMPTRTGIVYLAHQLKSMQDTDYVITTNESDFFRWEVGLPASVLPDVLQEDLARWSQITGEPPMILSHIVYPSDYPNSPPFVRIIRPRFQYMTGHVTIGGSICTELLTPQGWTRMSPKVLFDALAFIFREGRGRIQLERNFHHPAPFADYPSEHEAKEAFVRAAKTHGWRL